MDRSTARLLLPAGPGLEVFAESEGWRLELRAPNLLGTTAGQMSDVVAELSRWLVDQLTDRHKTLLDGDFQLHSFGRSLTSPPAGERLITGGQTNRSVVVGERLVVKWLRRIDDVDHSALRTLHHLDEVGFDGIPATFGALTWRSPSERELPCAFVTDYLPGAVTGWQWCVQAVQAGDRPGFPAELGLLTAKLHVALGTPSTLLPLPMLAVGTAQVRTWHAQARQRLAELASQFDVLDDAPAGRDGGRGRQVPSKILAENRDPMESAIDRLLNVPGRTPVQLVHGDLHVGQILSWSGGLSVIDFDGNPVLGGASSLGGAATRQPAARDVAQLLLSLDQVGRVVDRRSGFTRTAEINAWSAVARAEFLAAYRAELERVERRDVLDTRLLPAFLVAQACRDLLYAVRFRPRLAYATIDGLETILNDLPIAGPTQ